MHQNAFGGLAPPGPARETHNAPPDPLAVFGGGAGFRPRKGKRGGKGKRDGREMGKRGKEGRECAPPIFTGAPAHFLIPGVASAVVPKRPKPKYASLQRNHCTDVCNIPR